MTGPKSLVTASPERAWGATVFSGTRVPVEALFEYLEAGDTLDEFLRQFPTVTRQQAVALLEEAKVRVAEVAAGERQNRDRERARRRTDVTAFRPGGSPA